MRATLHNGRTDKAGRPYRASHNDRQYANRKPNLSFAGGLLNEYYTADPTGSLSPLDMTLADWEIFFYRQTFADMLQARNRRYKEQRHPERVKTIEQYYQGARSAPEETILQIGEAGDLDTVKDLDIFRECIRDFMARHARLWPDIRLLDVAIHADETSLHAHLRKVYIARNQRGEWEAAQNKCLKAAGFTLPEPGRPEGKHNNRKMTYTQAARGVWLDVCRSHGYEIEASPATISRAHMEIADYKRAAAAEHLAETEARLEKMTVAAKEQQARLDELTRQIQAHIEELAEAEKIRKWLENKTFRGGRYTAMDLYRYETMAAAQGSPENKGEKLDR